MRATNRLSARAVATVTRAGYHPDGGGLYLQVSTRGSKSWIFRYTLRGRSREMGLGPLALVSLAEARELREACRRQLLAGKDPLEARREERAAEVRDTFQQCRTAYVTAHASSWKNEKHRAQWESTLSTYAAALDPKPVREIDTSHVLAVLEPIWYDKTETATRVRQRIEAVLNWAAARKMRSAENPARWRGHLDKLLPPPARLKRVQHRSALPYLEAPAFMQVLRAKVSMTARALELTILTASRPNETAGARWEEFDLDAALWVVPPDRMKAQREHRIPLQPRAVEIVRAMPRLAPFVFPGVDETTGITTAALLALVQEMRPGLHTHGFRSTFRDWAADCTSYPREIAEAALAHVLKDKTEAAYRRTDLFEKRRQLMADWAAYCAGGDAPPPADC